MKKYDVIKNTSKKYFNGSKWESKTSGEFEIIGKINVPRYNGNGIAFYPFYLCQFKDGTVVVSHCNCIKEGKISNPNTPTVCGVGYLGEGKWKATINQKKTKEYTLWSGMLYRCYCHDNKRNRYKTYADCYVDSRWFNFQNFCDDIIHLDNYIHWKNEENWEIDKDTKVKGNRIYSKDTCVFLPKLENLDEMNSRTKKDKITGLTYVGISPDGEIFEFTNQKEFAEKHNLNQRHVNSCLKGRLKTHKKWKFKIKEKEGNNNG